MHKRARARARRLKAAVSFEQLEGRRLSSTVPIPAGASGAAIQSALNNSRPGDTISFAPGNYNLTAVTLASNRSYVGNGAVLQGGIAAAHNASGIDLSGFTLNGGGWDLFNSSNINLHNNVIQNDNGSIVLANDSNITIDNNTFQHDAGTSVGVTGPTFLDHVNVDHNSFDYSFEAVHLVWSGGGNSSVSHNVIQHATRHGIELQGGPQGLIVDGNWIDNWLTHLDPVNGNDSHMGISCATGVVDPNASNLVYATGVQVINNYIGGHGINLGRSRVVTGISPRSRSWEADRSSQGTTSPIGDSARWPVGSAAGA